MEEHKVGKLLIVVEKNLISERLILNCSAISHMFADKGFFFKFKPKNTGHFITIGSHNQVSVKRRELVFFQAHINNIYHNIILNDILYLPSLRVNLISLGALQRNDITVKSLFNRLVITLSGTNLFYTFMDSNQETLYHICYIGGRQPMVC